MRPIQTLFLSGLLAANVVTASALAQGAVSEPLPGAETVVLEAAPSASSSAQSTASVAAGTDEEAPSAEPDARASDAAQPEGAAPLTAADLLELAPEERSPGPFAAGEAELASFLWQNRVLVIFADTEQDLNFLRQMDLISARLLPLTERGVVVLIDTDPASRSPVRTKLRPRGFAAVLVDKDGRIVSRRPSPWDVREIERTIDSTPLRLQELRERRDAIDPLRGGSR